MNEEYNVNNGSGGASDEDNEYVYKTVMEGKRKSRAWSVASLVVSIFSVICCCLPWPGIVLGALSIVFAVISRKNIGYFDGLAIAGLIVGIFGVVFNVTMIIASYAIESSEFYQEFLKEYEKILNEQGGSLGDGNSF